MIEDGDVEAGSSADQEEGREKVTPLVVVLMRVMWERRGRSCLMVLITLMRRRIFLRIRMAITPTLIIESGDSGDHLKNTHLA